MKDSKDLLYYIESDYSNKDQVKGYYLKTSRSTKFNDFFLDRYGRVTNTSITKDDDINNITLELISTLN